MRALSSTGPTASGSLSNRETQGDSKLALVVIAAGNLLAALDLFIVNLAFSSIRDSFPGVSNQTLSWVLSAYAIAFAACLVPAGRLADRFGRKRVFRLGLLIFAIASTACAVAPDVLTLVCARALKGVGAAMIIPTSLGLLLAAYPQDRHKQMVGIWAAIGSIGAALGPVIGGFLVHIDWRLIFLINIPVAVPALWLSRRLVETQRIGTKVPDIIGSVSFASGVACIVAAISYANDWGLQSTALWSTSGIGLALLAFFVWRCLHSPVPALDLRVFRIPTFTVAALGMLCFNVGFAIAILGGTLYLTQVWHWDTASAGICFASGPAMAGLTALLAGRTQLAPAKLTVIGSLAFVLAGLWWFLALNEQSSFLMDFLPGLMLSGIAVGTTQTGFLSGGTASLAKSEYATGTGILNTAKQVGSAIGVAVLVAVSGSATQSAQYKTAFLIIVGTSVMAGLSALSLRKPKKRAIENDPVGAS